MRIGKIAVTAAIVSISCPSLAQMVDVPIWSNGILGQQALRHTYDNYNEKMGINKNRAKSLRSCSVDALPASERRAMEVEYVRRHRADGKASADAWVQEQGRRFRAKLIADGVCSSPGGSRRQVAETARPQGKKPLLNKHGRPCTKTRVENRVSPGFGGNAMTMGLVPVCAD